MLRRRMVCLGLALLLLLPMVLTGCSKEWEKTTLAFDENYGNAHVPSGEVARNDRFALYWDNDAQCALLEDTASGIMYMSAPEEYYYHENPQELSYDNEVYSPIKISYVDVNPINYTVSTMELYSYESSAKRYEYLPELDENGNPLKDEEGNVIDSSEMVMMTTDPTIPRTGVSSELIDGGIRINYAFADVQIAVSLELVLTDKGLQARIPMDRIQENDVHIHEIAVLPFMASALNGDDAYMFVPSGGGALIDAKTSLNPAKYSEPVYGEDKADFTGTAFNVRDQIYLPVFGARDANKGMLGVIDSGAATAKIYANTSGAYIEEGVEFSHVYASFVVRGHEKLTVLGTGNQAAAADSYSDEIAQYDYLSVQYYPLVGDTTYVGMANTYRQHLQDRGYLQTRSESAPALSVSLLGAVQTPESFFGIPYEADTATTTAKSAKEITSELNELVGKSGLLVTLKGYGKGGLSDTVVGGGFKLSSAIGSKKDWNALVNYGKENNVVMAMDYELVRFNKDSSGFKVSKACAHLPSTLDTQVGTVALNSAVEDKEGTYWNLLRRSKLSGAFQKALESAADLNVSAVSFDSLSHQAYGDYREPGYAAKGKMDTDVSALMSQCGEKGLKLVSDKANEYAALYADYIIETPTYTSMFSAFDKEIPFYSLVFQGYKNLTSPAINTAVNVRETYLRAVATGMTLQFTLCDTQHESLQFEANTAYISSVYSFWKDDITAMVQESADVHAKVGNQAITQYTIEDGMSTTVFEDGTTVYVNYTDEDMTCPAGTVPAMGFVYG